MTTTLEIARQYVEAGLSVIPIYARSKDPHARLLELTTGQTTNWIQSDPRAAWRVYCERMPRPDELNTWFAASDAGIGIVGGQVSGGLVRLDFESKGCLITWLTELLHTDEALGRAACILPAVETGKGHHVYFRMPDPPGHVVLCANGTGSDAIVFAETQGEGCYCVAPPSEGYTRDYLPFQYAWLGESHVSFQATPTFDQESGQKLLDTARFVSLWETHLGKDEGPGAERVATSHRYGITLTERNQGDGHVYNALTLSWAELRALRIHLVRYGSLLHAVETAPPPPPSYDIWDDGSDNDDDDE